MAQLQTKATKGLDKVDPGWARVRHEAEEITRREPELAAFVFEADGIHHDEAGAPFAHYVSTWSPRLRLVEEALEIALPLVADPAGIHARGRNREQERLEPRVQRAVPRRDAGGPQQLWASWNDWGVGTSVRRRAGRRIFPHPVFLARCFDGFGSVLFRLETSPDRCFSFKPAGAGDPGAGRRDHDAAHRP